LKVSPGIDVSRRANESTSRPNGKLSKIFYAALPFPNFSVTFSWINLSLYCFLVAAAVPGTLSSFRGTPPFD